MSDHRIQGNAGESGTDLERAIFKASKYRVKYNSCVVFTCDKQSGAEIKN
jgi:hypothetical protein